MNTIARAIEGIGVRRSGDADIFERALRGDPVAFSEVYRRYYDRVFAFCLSRLLSREAAKDAAQESFVRALSANASGVTSPASWLFGIARHVCIDVARDAAHGHPASAADVSSDETVLPSARSAEDAALSKQAASKVLMALRKTNPRYRSALILREIHQQPMADVAEALGVNLDTAYTVLSRARDAFGKSYAEILDLPAPCSRAVELSYRRTGSGLTAVETTALDAHLSSCAKCRREAAKVGGGKGLQALLLLTPWASSRSGSLLERAAAVFGLRPWPVEALPGVAAEWSVPQFAAIAAAAVGLIALGGPTVPDAALDVRTASLASAYHASPAAWPTRHNSSNSCSAQNGAAGSQAQVIQRVRVRAKSGSGTASGVRTQNAGQGQPASKSGSGSKQSSGGGTQKAATSSGTTTRAKSSGSGTVSRKSTSSGSSKSSSSGSSGSGGSGGSSGSGGGGSGSSGSGGKSGE
jgi:RNA polymerase sigma factor (sigma-70 family)